MDSGDIEDNQEERAPAVSPGRLLRETREKTGLSTLDVAQRLRLEARLIEALERDDDAALPAPIYVTGYLRAYAKLLGLNENELVSHYPKAIDSTTTLLPDNVDYGTGHRRSAMPLMFALLLLLVGTVLTVIWWWPTDSDRPPEPLPTLTPAAKPAEVVAETNSETIETQSTDPGQEPPGEVASATVESNKKPGTKDTQGISAGYAEPMLLNLDSLPDANNMTGPAGMDLTYRSDSWTEIRDASGRRLVYRLVTAGSRLELRGEPPFSVLLGYAPAVSITYNGQPFDLGAVTRNDIARFEIGGPAGPVVPR